MPQASKPQPQKQAPNQSAASQPAQTKGPTTITIALPEINLDTGPQFQMKLVLLGLFLVILAFSFYLFVRTGVTTSDLFEINRITYNVQKLWSVMTILFVVLYGIALGIAAYYGQGLPKAQAAIPLIAGFIVALIAGLLAPSHSMAFYGFAIAAGTAAIAATFAKDLSLSALWGATSKALTLLLILAFIFTLMRVSANRDQYFSSLAAGMAETVPSLASEAAPAVGSEALNLCATAIEQSTIDEAAVRSVLTEDAFKQQVSTVQEFSVLPQAQRDALAVALYPTAVNQTVFLANAVKGDLAAAMRNIDVSKQLGNSGATVTVTPAQVKSMLSKLPFGKQLYSMLPLATALAVVSILTVLNFFIHIIATLVAYALGKALSV